ncbi:hypothetical protein D3C84_1314520 [compost metagenome]
MVRKNSLARDFITSATFGLASSARAWDRGIARESEDSTATAKRRPANGSFMYLLRIL